MDSSAEWSHADLLTLLGVQMSMQDIKCFSIFVYDLRGSNWSDATVFLTSLAIWVENYLQFWEATNITMQGTGSVWSAICFIPGPQKHENWSGQGPRRHTSRYSRQLQTCLGVSIRDNQSAHYFWKSSETLVALEKRTNHPLVFHPKTYYHICWFGMSW